MANQWDVDPDDDDGFDDDDTGQQQRQDNPKGLRRQLQKLARENKALKEAHDKLMSEQRTRTIAEALTAKGVNPKIAKLIPADVDGTEAVDKWLSENADLFPPVKAEEDAGEADKPSEQETEEAAQMGRISRVADGALSPERQADLMSKLTDPNLTQEGLLKMVQAQGGGYGVG